MFRRSLLVFAMLASSGFSYDALAATAEEMMLQRQQEQIEVMKRHLASPSLSADDRAALNAQIQMQQSQMQLIQQNGIEATKADLLAKQRNSVTDQADLAKKLNESEADRQKRVEGARKAGDLERTTKVAEQDGAKRQANLKNRAETRDANPLDATKTLACTALMCSLSPTRPKQCVKALLDYPKEALKNIGRHPTPSKIRKALKNFLKLCPNEHKDEDAMADEAAGKGLDELSLACRMGIKEACYEEAAPVGTNNTSQYKYYCEEEMARSGSNSEAYGRCVGSHGTTDPLPFSANIGGPVTPTIPKYKYYCEEEKEKYGSNSESYGRCVGSHGTMDPLP